MKSAIIAPMEPLRYTFHDSPVGPLLLAGSPSRLHFISFPTGRTALRPRADWLRDNEFFPEVGRQLDAYFAGELTEFDLPIGFHGSAFENAVWRALCDIPYGVTVSYGDIARAIGEDVAASRAVGIANGRNPLPIVVPCHRVIGADGTLTGFGGGLATKQFLIDLEARVRPMPGQQLRLFA
ncbi:MAG: methylated-DNA--[protein]-cysteine S-methyltransferase [Rhizobiaceae bacterium]